MSWKSEVRELFEAHKKARDALIETSKSQEDGWQTKYGRIRGDLRNTLDALQLAIERQKRLHSDAEVEECYEAVTSFRKVLENHHARWPVLIIKDRGADYQASMKAVNDGYLDLKQLMDRL